MRSDSRCCMHLRLSLAVLLLDPREHPRSSSLHVQALDSERLRQKFFSHSVNLQQNRSEEASSRRRSRPKMSTRRQGRRVNHAASALREKQRKAVLRHHHRLVPSASPFDYSHRPLMQLRLACREIRVPLGSLPLSTPQVICSSRMSRMKRSGRGVLLRPRRRQSILPSVVTLTA